VKVEKINTGISVKSVSRSMIEIKEVGVIIPIIVAAIIFGVINPDFFSFENIINVLRNSSFTFITAIGMTYVLITGSFDLSVGSQMACGGLFTGLLMLAGVPTWLAIVIGILSGVVLGSINGYVIEYLKVPPMIATMSTMMIYRGIVYVVLKGEPLYPLPKDFAILGQNDFLKIPYIIIITVVLGIIAGLILKYTVFGRMIYAVGGNGESARLSGIPVRRVKFITYILIGALATFTGILYASRFGSVQSAVGSGSEMIMIAAAIIGGTSILGGSGTIFGTVLGSIFMNMITNGMTLAKISPYYQSIVIGLIIIFAVSLDQIRVNLKK
jgi:Ribose/xylose/arabinose/galactoside ABC-type transport systems, permease components